jgi:hypothetical protein
MSAIAVEQTPATNERIDRCVAELVAAKSRLANLSLAERIALMQDCLERVVKLAPEWVDAACDAKGLAPGNPLRAEEITAGPVATARHLQLLIHNFQSVASKGHIELPAAPKQGADGSLRVQVMPVKGLFDALVFAGFRAEAWMAPEVTRADLDRLGSQLKSPQPARCVLVLGAGNVSSIPATDTISKVFQEGHVVLLKMNPVNEYLGPIFERLFARLIDAGFVRVIYGGADVGKAAVEHEHVDEVHITGSIPSSGGRRDRNASGASAKTIPCSRNPSRASWATSARGSSCRVRTATRSCAFRRRTSLLRSSTTPRSIAWPRR